MADFITRCYRCFFRSKHPITDKHYHRRRIAAYVMAAVALAAAAVAAKTSGDVTDAVHTVTQSLDDVLIYDYNINMAATALLHTIDVTFALIRSISNSSELSQSYQQMATTAATTIHTASTDGYTMLAQSPNMTEIRDIMTSLTDINRHRGYGTASILFACCLTMALLIGYHTHHTICYFFIS
jgi:hypothetical protein